MSTSPATRATRAAVVRVTYVGLPQWVDPDVPAA